MTAAINTPQVNILVDAFMELSVTDVGERQTKCTVKGTAFFTGR
jgi:hypothetical protein